MLVITDPMAARALLSGLAATASFAALPLDTRARLLEAASAVSIVDAVCATTELMYARKGELDAWLLGAGAGLAAFATLNAWYGLAQDARGAGIMAAMRRDAGEAHPTAGTWPDPSEDPAPLAQYLPA